MIVDTSRHKSIEDMILHPKKCAYTKQHVDNIFATTALCTLCSICSIWIWQKSINYYLLVSPTSSSAHALSFVLRYATAKNSFSCGSLGSRPATSNMSRLRFLLLLSFAFCPSFCASTVPFLDAILAGPRRYIEMSISTRHAQLFIKAYIIYYAE